MYYKITNKECDVYEKLHKMRTDEKIMDENNLKSIKEKVKLDFKNSLGYHGQQNFRRVSEYEGFEFIDVDKVDPKIWVKSKDHDNIFIPNRRTKLGREMFDFLRNKLSYSYFYAPFDILNIEVPGRFKFPYVEIYNDIIVLFIDDKFIIEYENVIEITKKEFEEIRDSK